MKKHCFFDYIVIVGFIINITLPLCFTHNQKQSDVEKRTLAPFPKLKGGLPTVLRFPDSFEHFYDDHFGLRETLVYWYNWLHFKLGVSPSKRVIIGKDDWLFFAGNKYVNPISDYRGNDQFQVSELEQWRLHLETKYYWLQEQGIEYLFVIPPNKHTVYSEYLPSRLMKTGELSRYDQFVNYMDEHSAVPILDLRPALLEAKSLGQLYNKTDTHWNSMGANIAQYAIMSYVSQKEQSIQPKLYSKDDFTLLLHSGGDLANMLNLGQKLQEMTPVLIFPKEVFEIYQLKKKDYFPQSNDHRFFTVCEECQEVSSLVFRDSFFIALQPYISQYFKKATYIWDQPQPDFSNFERFVKEFSPDVIIEERIERQLRLVPKVPDASCQSYQTYLKHL